MNPRIKALLYKSNYRGCKETDILIGKFAKENIGKFSEIKLDLFANFINEDDANIYDWILNKKNSPKNYESLIQEIRKFHDL